MSGSSRHPVLHILILAIKNLVGALLIFSGILMLVLPGQGLLTIIIGLILKEFPGKYSIERWLVNRHSVLLAINWIRVKAGKPELVASFGDDPGSQV